MLIVKLKLYLFSLCFIDHNSVCVCNSPMLKVFSGRRVGRREGENKQIPFNEHKNCNAAHFCLFFLFSNEEMSSFDFGASAQAKRRNQIFS